MRLFFGFTLSETAVAVIFLLATLPIIKSAGAGNILPIVAGALVFCGLQLIRGVKSLGVRVLLALLVAMILVPVPFRGKRMWEGFADSGPIGTDEMSNSVEIPTVEEVKGDEVEDEEDATAMATESFKGALNAVESPPQEREPADLKDLGEKYLKVEAKKKYRLPSEKDDGEYHIDSGTTFMNAYKQLKPEQINALTSDTQKLISVQKDLMSNLSNLKPLISDGKEIMRTFKSFFGSDPISS
jgi:hypothetical protein